MESSMTPVESEITDGMGEQLYPPELSLFETPSLHSPIADETMVEYRPINPNLNSGGSIDFVVPPSVAQFVSLAESRLHLKLSVVTGDDKHVDPAMGKLTTTINYIAATLFESVQLFLNQTLVTTSGGQMSAYKSYVEVLLDRSRFEKDTTLQTGLYFKDSAQKMNDFVQVDGTGFGKRWTVTSGSKQFDVSAPIFTDLAQQNRLLISNVEIILKLWPAKPAFCLLTADAPSDYKIHIHQASLRIRKKRPHAAITLAISRALEIKPALYPFLRTEMRQHIIQKGAFSFNIENLFDSNIPTVLVLGLVDARGVAGSMQFNPFNFEHSNLSSLDIYIDDQPCTDSRMVLNYIDGDYIKSSYRDGYASLFKNWSSEEDQNPAAYCDINLKDFHGGYALYVFRFNSASNGSYLPMISRGNLRVTGRFDKGIKKNSVLIMYARFPAMLQIDKSRNVVY